MFILIFFGVIVSVGVVSGLLVARRRRLTGDYSDRIESTGQNDNGYNNAKAAAVSANAARMTGGRF